MRVDTTGIRIFALQPYTFLVLVGLIVSFSVYLVLLYRRDIPVQSQFPRLVLSLPGLLLGAKLVGSAGHLLYCLQQGAAVSWRTLLQGGIAYYGGLFGLLLAFALLGKLKRFRGSEAWDALAAAIPLFHTFGRVGCFLAGCCFGIPYTGPGAVLYTNVTAGVTVTAWRFPVQLLEAGGNLLLFLLLLLLYLRGRRHLLRLYLICYAALRFLTELLRGDVRRGLAGSISTSQIISLLVLAVIGVFLLCRRKKAGTAEQKTPSQ